MKISISIDNSSSIHPDIDVDGRWVETWIPTATVEDRATLRKAFHDSLQLVDAHLKITEDHEGRVAARLRFASDAGKAVGP